MTLLLFALLVATLAIAARADAFIYWADNPSGKIGRSDLAGSGVDHNFVTTLNNPCGVAVDDNYVYWANGPQGSIGRANLNGTAVDQTFIGGADDPCGVAVDDNFVYWANSGFGDGGSIGRANLDGSSPDQSFIAGTRGPCGVAVDDNFVYWGNASAAGSAIGRANLDGTSPNQSFISGANAPCGVAVNDQFVYWANNGNDRIGRANLNGTTPNQSFITGALAPCGVAVDDNFVYWGNQGDETGGGGVGRANLDGTSPNESFIRSSGPCGVAVNADTPEVNISPESLEFGDQLVGGTTAAQTVTITNSSGTTASLDVDALSIVGPDSADFGIDTDGCSNQTVAPGDSCQVSFDFSPNSLGGKAATVSIPSNAPNSPMTVQLAGTGTDPNQSVEPPSFDFGNQLVGTTSSTQNVTLTNGPGASAPDQIGQATIVGGNANQFSIASDGCSNTIVAINASCQITLEFGPTTLGQQQASLSIPSDDPTSPATVALSGTGVTPEESVSPTAIQFGSQLVGGHSSTRTVTVSNSADATAGLAVGTVSLAGTQFDLAFDSCSSETIQPGDDCQLGVRFTPGAAGAASGSVQIPSNGSASPVSVSLSGTGTNPAPPPPTPPDNNFTITGAKKNKRKGTAKLIADLPGAGVVELAGAKVKAASEETVDAGEVSLRVKARGKAKKKLKTKGKARVALDVTFTPVGGDPNTESDALKLIRKRGR